jgi:subtilisin family serine protease
LTVGAFDTSEMAYLAPPYPATAAGPTRPTGNPTASRDKPELSAPGNNIVAARAYGGTTVMSGTSMAAAHVTGLVALLFERAKRAGQGLLSIETTRQILMAEAKGVAAPSAKDVLRLGSRRIDGAGALSEFLSVAPPATPVQETAAPMSAPVAVLSEFPSNGEEAPNDLLKKLIAQLQHAAFKLKVGNDGEVATAKLNELVSMLDQTSFELMMDPPH